MKESQLKEVEELKDKTEAMEGELAPVRKEWNEVMAINWMF